MARYLFILFCFLPIINQAQSIFSFSFQQPNSNRAKGLLILQPDGNGMMRYVSGNSIMEQQLEEAVTLPLPGEQMPLQVLYEGKKASIIKGNGAMQLISLQMKLVNGMLHPAAVIIKGANSAEIKLDSVVFFDHAQLTKSLVAEFILPSEALYKQLFNSSTKALSPLQKDTRIHLLIVANSNDSTVGVAAKKDMQTVEDFFKDLTEVMGIKDMQVTKVHGNNFSRNNVLASLQKLKPQPNDIVVFYYTGHGFRTARTASPYPMFDLRSHPKQNYLKESLTTDTVAHLIKTKGARMSLILSDCCNWDPDMPLPFVAADPQTRSTNIPWDVDKCRALFLHPQRGQIIGVAADKNQLAVSNEVQGSFFFKYFRESLISAISKTYRSFGTGQDWHYIAESTKAQTFRKSKKTYCSKPYIPTNICNQTPKFLIP